MSKVFDKNILDKISFSLSFRLRVVGFKQLTREYSFYQTGQARATHNHKTALGNKQTSQSTVSSFIGQSFILLSYKVEIE